MTMSDMIWSWWWARRVAVGQENRGWRRRGGRRLDVSEQRMKMSVDIVTNARVLGKSG
jgi:hypothetical protein